MKIMYCLFFAMVIGCKSGHRRVQKRIVDNYIVEGVFVNDSLYDGVLSFFNLKGELESRINFLNGIKNGVAVNYHKNGHIYDSCFYESGLRHGDHFIFDSTGNLIYRGFRIGHQIFYKNQKARQFIFSNFEKQTIYSCEYDSIGIARFGGEILNTSIYKTNIDNTPYYGIFVYLIYPPNVFVKYTLGIEDIKLNVKRDLQVFSNDRMFIDTVLRIPKSNEQYFISAEFNDSANKFHKIYLDKLEW